jgi:hypothetical protein
VLWPAREECSFLKKRTKKLLGALSRSPGLASHNPKGFLGSFSVVPFNRVSQCAGHAVQCLSGALAVMK